MEIHAEDNDVFRSIQQRKAYDSKNVIINNFVSSYAKTFIFQIRKYFSFNAGRESNASPPWK